MVTSNFLLEAQRSEQRLCAATWTDRCSRRLGELLAGLPRSQLGTRAAALWLIADCMPPEEAAELASSWWR